MKKNVKEYNEKTKYTVALMEENYKESRRFQGLIDDAKDLLKKGAVSPNDFITSFTKGEDEHQRTVLISPHYGGDVKYVRSYFVALCKFLIGDSVDQKARRHFEKISRTDRLSEEHVDIGTFFDTHRKDYSLHGELVIDLRTGDPIPDDILFNRISDECDCPVGKARTMLNDFRYECLVAEKAAQRKAVVGKDRELDNGMAVQLLRDILETYMFKDSELGAKVLAHQLWNVKRGILRLPVQRNMIVNLSSIGGLGKTELMKRFVEPISAYCNTEISVDRLLDPFAYEALKRTLTITSELSVCSRRDRNIDDEIKCLVDCSVTQRRRIHDDKVDTVVPRCVIIGTANKEIGDCMPYLSDQNRRYFDIHSVACVEHFEAIHREADSRYWNSGSFDVCSIYRALDPKVDPLTEEDWVEVRGIQVKYICNEGLTAWLDEANDEELDYKNYREFCAEHKYGRVPMANFNIFMDMQARKKKLPSKKEEKPHGKKKV